MGVAVVVLYKEALAHYYVRAEKDGTYTSELVSYSGQRNDMPPPNIRLTKGELHVSGEANEQKLMTDIYNAVHQKVSQVIR